MFGSHESFGVDSAEFSEKPETVGEFLNSMREGHSGDLVTLDCIRMIEERVSPELSIPMEDSLNLGEQIVRVAHLPEEERREDVERIAKSLNSL